MINLAKVRLTARGRSLRAARRVGEVAGFFIYAIDWASFPPRKREPLSEIRQRQIVNEKKALRLIEEVNRMMDTIKHQTA